MQAASHFLLFLILLYNYLHMFKFKTSPIYDMFNNMLCYILIILKMPVVGINMYKYRYQSKEINYLSCRHSFADAW